MDHDQWGAIYFIIVVILMMIPSTIGKARRQPRVPKTSNPDQFFDTITEFQNDFA